MEANQVYIERCDKETENLLAEEGQAFLSNPIDYLLAHKNEFVYIEATHFNEIGVDALSIEIDDVFGTYDVMLGLKLQKKHEQTIKAFLNRELQGDDIKYDLMFDQNDGLWNVNFTLNYLPDFRESMTFQEAFTSIYEFLAKLVQEVKN
ncbi:branched-chain amino acid aminotransferase [Robertmurraya yapensis]|uniref:Branched-chain amino acid aminotransferase n=1 Tax=Bacillus yapensis TaxID=2492960 RepID=A0A3S0IA51_9BACI|nr:branched-chain amino acid aminotransferase [Bacillus yapensis]RTR28792.1 branched-chain amino acid aminotransferase [Bacillus yapensis]TKS94650.1 branched-chain amino acid aminotransferase [Bacillus yapensis]